MKNRFTFYFYIVQCNVIDYSFKLSLLPFDLHKFIYLYFIASWSILSLGLSFQFHFGVCLWLSNERWIAFYWQPQSSLHHAHAHTPYSHISIVFVGLILFVWSFFFHNFLFACLISISVLCLIVELCSNGCLSGLRGSSLHRLIAQKFIGKFGLCFVNTHIFRWSINGMNLQWVKEIDFGLILHNGT